MADGARVDASSGVALAMEALLGSRPHPRPRVVAGPGVEGLDTFGCPATVFLDNRELVKALRSASPPRVVVLAALTPTILRALREHPPALVVTLTGISAERVAELRSIDGLLVLGPDAVLRVGSGDAVACAHGSGELEGLCRALGPKPPRIAMSPTPPWLCQWLRLEAASGLTVAGYVPASSLSTDWARWAKQTDVPHVLVPVGVEAPPVEQPRAPGLEAAVAAHTLERLTGPVFPAPRVLSLVLGGLAGGVPPADDDPPEVAPDQLMLWAQARRALPVTGAVVGMERPRDGMPLQSPTAAFLAQRALLRATASLQLIREGLEPPETADADGIARALEILQSSAENLTDQESKVVLRGFGLEVTRQAVASSASGAAGYAERIGYPVVLKALSPDLRRRSDIGAVVLGLETAAAVRRAYADIVANVERDAPTVRLDGVLVAEMLEDGLDIRCGGVRTASGEVVLHGSTLDPPTPVEPALGLSPLRLEDALLLAHAVLSRVPVPALRRASDPDVRGLAELFLRLDRLFSEAGERVLAVDLGPVRLVGPPRGYVTLDARITQRPHLEGL